MDDSEARSVAGASMRLGPSGLQSPLDALGWEILRAGLEEIRAVLGARLAAAYALGSLAHGGFSPAASDVDLAVIVDTFDPSVTSIIQYVQKQVGARFGTALAGRLSVFWASWDALRSDGSGGRFPLADRLDLIHHGVLLFGEDRRSLVVVPTGNALWRRLVVEAAEFMLAKLASGASALPLDLSVAHELGCREVTKAVLFPVRFIQGYVLPSFRLARSAITIILQPVASDGDRVTQEGDRATLAGRNVDSLK